MKKIIRVIHHLFIPQSKNKYRAKVLHLDFMTVSLGILVLFSLFSDKYYSSHGEILGYATDISIQKNI